MKFPSSRGRLRLRKRRTRALRGRPAGPLLLGLPLLLLSGCSTLGLGGEAEPEILQVSGEYTGTLMVAGQQVFGTLFVEQEGQELELRFRLPEVGLQAAGGGSVTTSGFTAEVPFTITCPARAALTGSQDPRDRALVGRLTVTDCDGTSSGTFRFAPRD